ncbi:MAG: heavy metal-associated domain-containing protein [Candidatus Woesearchaeota archaeon]|jgi:copper chaperone CopZ
MKISKLNVKGMHCKSCEEIIKDSLLDIKGVDSVKPDSKNNVVVVSYDEKLIELTKIKEIIKNEGYEVL